MLCQLGGVNLSSNNIPKQTQKIQLEDKKEFEIHTKKWWFFCWMRWLFSTAIILEQLVSLLPCGHKSSYILMETKPFPPLRWRYFVLFALWIELLCVVDISTSCTEYGSGKLKERRRGRDNTPRGMRLGLDQIG